MFKYILEKRNIVFILLAIYWFILFVATTLPGKDVPDIGLSDKSEHFIAYSLLTFFLSITLFLQHKFVFFQKKAILSAIILAASYGILDELHQIFIPGRTADVRDWMADCIGIIMGAILTKLLVINKLEKLTQQ